MKELWQRIARVMDTEFAPPITLDELDDFVANVGFIDLPQDMIDSFLVTNGGWGYGFEHQFIGGIECWPISGDFYWNSHYEVMMSLLEDGTFGDGILRGREAPKSPALKPHYWNPKWLPIMGSQEVYWCVDCDPAPAGRYGQIIAWEEDSGGQHLVATSLSVLLTRMAERLEAGLLPNGAETRAEAAIEWTPENIDLPTLDDKYEYMYWQLWRNIGTDKEETI